MTTEENKAIVRRYIEVGWSKGDMGVVSESVASDYRHHTNELAGIPASGKSVDFTASDFFHPRHGSRPLPANADNGRYVR